MLKPEPFNQGLKSPIGEISSFETFRFFHHALHSLEHAFVAHPVVEPFHQQRECQRPRPGVVM